jgi:hypothetical protein
MGDCAPNMLEMVLLVRDRELISRQSQTWGCCPDLGWKVVRIHIPTTHGKVLWSCR